MADVPLADDSDISKDVRLVIQTGERFTIDWWLATYNTPAREARRMIRHMLRDVNYTVNTKGVTLEAIQRATKLEGSEEEEAGPVNSMTGDAQYSGVVWALCNSHYANGVNVNNVGPVIAGRPVVLDTITGYALTGINPLWMPDEYQVFGTALQTAPKKAGLQRLPVLLHKQHDVYSQFYVARLLEDLVPPLPAKARILVANSASIAVNGKHGWTPRVTAGIDYDMKVYAIASGLTDAAGSTIYPRYKSGSDLGVAYEHITGRWTLISQQFTNLTLRVVLTENLLSNSSALATVYYFNTATNLWEVLLSAAGQPQQIPVKDWHLPPECMLPAGTRLTVDFDWSSRCFVVLAASPVNYYGTTV